ncbi:hypothetical protein AVEN_182463-1 [Araneus ventricosus]|uniref:Uncharacterized protein n=1 Tax=Araneus ventricosus TaxID=182803 RepID=A0A4Y2K0W8_ARAVE|nr:hypothetical protein AVEN_182463-1 [Araneus ventricosus]
MWLEVIPTVDMLAETTASSLLSGWISSSGELTNRLGSHRIDSSSYYLQSNGMFQRLHRHLKSDIITHEDTGWSNVLPIVMLGLRSAVKNDLSATSLWYQLVYFD